LHTAIKALPYLQDLGVNAIQIMPSNEFAGDVSWGYNPADIFAIESAYGGPRAFKEYVNAVHAHGMIVILDVVYNHFGPSDFGNFPSDDATASGGGRDGMAYSGTIGIGPYSAIILSQDHV
jgi:1,4-alpha-glucan branching enzyme